MTGLCCSKGQICVFVRDEGSLTLAFMVRSCQILNSSEFYAWHCYLQVQWSSDQKCKNYPAHKHFPMASLWELSAAIATRFYRCVFASRQGGWNFVFNRKALTIQSILVNLQRVTFIDLIPIFHIYIYMYIGLSLMADSPAGTKVWW